MWKAYLFWIILSEAVGGQAAWMTTEGMKSYNETVIKPVLSPPSVLFPIVWAILYVLMGIGAARIYKAPAGSARSYDIGIFLAQLAVNFFWSIIFFQMQAFGFAFAWLILLWILVAVMILLFYRVDKIAAWLQIPYLLWLTFAGYLNCAVWILN